MFASPARSMPPGPEGPPVADEMRSTICERRSRLEVESVAADAAASPAASAPGAPGALVGDWPGTRVQCCDMLLGDESALGLTSLLLLLLLLLLLWLPLLFVRFSCRDAPPAN